MNLPDTDKPCLAQVATFLVLAQMLFIQLRRGYIVLLLSGVLALHYTYLEVTCPLGTRSLFVPCFWYIFM